MSWAASVLLAILFIVSGIWKISDPQGAAMRMTQVGIPQSLGLATAMLVGIAETVAGVLVLVPRFRRWGAILAGLLLVAFMIYVGAQYNYLRGADCSCFPWVERLVGPGFFVGDGVMLLLAIIAWLWARPASSIRSAVLVVGAVVVFALVSYGVNEVRHMGRPAPPAIAVDGQRFSLQSGKVFLFFFHPECMHCFAAAQKMATADWGNTKVVAVPVAQPQFASYFLKDTGLRAVVTSDFQMLKQAFGYTTYPWGIAVENGREKARLTKFEGDEPVAALQKLGFIKASSQQH
jgi:uncharacterized membrane protein YphA (DoxX/SURF4 family)